METKTPPVRSPDPPVPGLAAGPPRPRLRGLRRALALVRHRPRCVLAEHLGLLRSAVAHPAHGRAGAQCDAGGRVVPRGAGQLRAPGAAPCGPGARRGPAGRGEPQRARPAPRAVLARAAPPGRLARAAPAPPGRAARRPRGGLPAQHPRGHGGPAGHGQPGRGVERVRARHGHGRRAGPLPPDRAQGADRSGRRDLRRARPRPHRRAGRAARGAALGHPHGGGAAPACS